MINVSKTQYCFRPERLFFYYHLSNGFVRDDEGDVLFGWYIFVDKKARPFMPVGIHVWKLWNVTIFYFWWHMCVVLWHKFQWMKNFYLLLQEITFWNKHWQDCFIGGGSCFPNFEKFRKRPDCDAFTVPFMVNT